MAINGLKALNNEPVFLLIVYNPALSRYEVKYKKQQTGLVVANITNFVTNVTMFRIALLAKRGVEQKAKPYFRSSRKKPEPARRICLRSPS